MIRKENPEFIYFAVKRVWMAAGATELHAHYVADAIRFAHLQGKLNQGLGVFEVLDISLQMALLDIKAEPQLISEGPAWAVVDGQRSSGYWCLNLMAEIAIEKARDAGIAIVYGGNHNDAGSFARYVYRAFEKDMFAMSSNNTVPLAAPLGVCSIVFPVRRLTLFVQRAMSAPSGRVSHWPNFTMPTWRKRVSTTSRCKANG